MILHQTLDRARAGSREVRKPQFVGRITDLIVPDAGSPAPRPQAFLVEQSAHWTLPTHFHVEHQFQLFVAGGGTIGKRPVEPLDVHYASPHSGYGPLISAGEGISYLTLRAVGDTGAWYLPEQREKNLRIPKVQAHGAPRDSVSSRDLAALASPTTQALIEPTQAGPAAWLLRLGAGQRLAQPQGQASSGGRFVVVTRGGLRLDGSEIDALGVAWLDVSETLVLQAGAQGLEAVVLQFPRQAAQSFAEGSRSDPCGPAPE